TERLAEAQEQTAEGDALVVMQGSIKALGLVCAAFEFDFMGGSMGSVVGARFMRGVRVAIEQQMPFVCVCASGGARMQEGLLSLAQMAKTTAALTDLAERRLPFITVLTDPTMGGVSASFAMLGDAVIAEPKALIGFAGPRVIEQTVRQKLPEGFQRAEFLLEKGAIDMIVDRRQLRDKLHALLTEVVRTSAQVAATSSRLAKTTFIAESLKRLQAEEVEIALPWLSGEIRQGKLTLGYATLRSAIPDPAAAPMLTVTDVDAAFERLKGLKGKGSAGQRAEQLKGLFSKATAEEQDFLLRLIVGELRQGALEGVMLEAVAAAADLPPAEVRRAATFAGGIPQVARAALEGGGLEQFSIRLMQPVLPMLAQPAEDVASALADLGTALFEWKLDGARIQVHKAGGEMRVFTRNLND